MLEGVTGVFLVGPGSASDWSPQLSLFLDRAHEAGVERAVLLSARAVRFQPGGVVARAETTFRVGPVPGSVLRPAHFAQNFTEAMFVPQNGLIHAPVGSARHPFVDVDDIAEVAARVLVHGGHVGQDVELSGPAALTFDDVAQLLSAAGGERVTYVPESRDDHIRRLLGTGLPQSYVTWRMTMLDAIAAGQDTYLSDSTDRVLGRPATSFEQFLARPGQPVTTPTATDPTAMAAAATRSPNVTR